MSNIIAIDIGNTETTVGIGSNGVWESYRFTTRDTNTSDELLSLFNSTFQMTAVSYTHLTLPTKVEV